MHEMKEDKTKHPFSEEKKRDLPLYPIGIVSDLLGTTDQTLRLYEKHGLIKASRRGRNRYYSENDIKWLQCLRDLIHIKKISIQGIKKLFEYAPCWEITDCPHKIRETCSAYINNTKPCWELNKMICKRKESMKTCEDCVIYISDKRGIKKRL